MARYATAPCASTPGKFADSQRPRLAARTPGNPQSAPPARGGGRAEPGMGLPGASS